MTVSALAIDPGLNESAAVRVEVDRQTIAPPWGVVPTTAGDMSNELLRQQIIHANPVPDVLVIEVIPYIFSAGAGGRDQLKTDRWAGRFIEAFIRRHEVAGNAGPLVCEVWRQSAKTATVGRANKVKDSDVRQGIIAHYGGQREAFGVICRSCKSKGWRGRDREPCEACMATGWEVPAGPLYGMKGSHVFAALACAFAAFQPGGHYDEATA